MFLIVEGVVVSGMDGAATMLNHHLPHFAKDHPELADCKPGTINVRLDRPLRFKSPDFCIGSFSYLNGREESYGFVLIGLEVPPGSPPQRAWIYLPDNLSHMDNWHQVEIIAPPLETVTIDARCRIHIQRSFEVVTVVI